MRDGDSEYEDGEGMTLTIKLDQIVKSDLDEYARLINETPENAAGPLFAMAVSRERQQCERVVAEGEHISEVWEW